MRQHGIAFHIYADDDNLYLAFKPLGISSAFISIKMIVNMLGINDTKIHFTVINGSRRKTLDIPSLRVSEANIMSSTYIKALGVHIDNTLSMQKQVNEVSRASFAKLSNMYKIRECITEDGAKTMVFTMITSGLDYCNSLYCGLPNCLLEKLYCVQKSAARLITLTAKYEHITQLLLLFTGFLSKRDVNSKSFFLPTNALMDSHQLTLKNCYIKDLTVDLAGTMTICLLFQS